MWGQWCQRTTMRFGHVISVCYSASFRELLSTRCDHPCIAQRVYDPLKLTKFITDGYAPRTFGVILATHDDIYKLILE